MTDQTDTAETVDLGFDFEVTVVESVPSIVRKRETGSKYAKLFDMARDAETRTVSFKVEDDTKAQSRASYLRRLADEGDNADIEVSQRGVEVYVQALTKAEQKARDAKNAERAKAAANS